MGVKTNIVLGVMAAGGLTLGGGSVAYQVFMNQKAHQATSQLGTFDLAQVAGYAPTDADTALELKHVMDGGNTLIVWELGKNKPTGEHMEFDGTWTILTGGLVYNAQAQELKALEVIIQADSIIGYGAEHYAPAPLTNTLIGQTPAPAWFDVEAHPTATFTATEFVARDAVGDDVELPENAPTAWTHLVRGSFTLNGVESELALPAVVTFAGEEVVVELAFTIDRQQYNIDGVAVGWEVEDLVHLTATVESSPAGDIVNDTLRAYGEKLSAQEAEIARLSRFENQIEELNNQIAALREQLASGAAVAGNGGTPAPQVDLASLPARFTDYVPRYIFETQQTLDPVAFDMVLVPGDAAAGIAPFYMSETEVTWEMFYDWSYRRDLDGTTAAELEAQNLRPSTLYGDSDQIYIGLDKRPAISMSRRTAEAFCAWLSEQTGRRYRLPTDAEWHLALELGGGIPDAEDALLAQATFLENTEEHPDKWIPMTTEVAQRAPNALGIYDMLGNAAEWVTDTGADRVVRGGHFLLPMAEFVGDWGAVEDQSIWNRTYPQAPVSKFWYRDHYYQGIRLVCDPVNLPE